MNLNNKGFAISGILYTLFIMFLLISISILAGLSNQKNMLEQSITNEENSFTGKKIENIEEIKNQKNAIVKGKYIYILTYNGNTQKCYAYLKKGTDIYSSDIEFVPSICNEYDSDNLELSEVYSFEKEWWILKKKNKIAKKIWITSIFLELIVILIMIIDYKINYQYLTKNKLYFYECIDDLCVTEIENKEHITYSIYNCEYEECPIYIKKLDDNHVLLRENNNHILYRYRTGEIISKDYDYYQILNSKYIIVTKNNKKGIINYENDLIIETIYEEIGYMQNGYLTGYNLNQIIVKQNEKYGIISYKNGEIIKNITEPIENIDKLLKIINEGDN